MTLYFLALLLFLQMFAASQSDLTGYDCSSVPTSSSRSLLDMISSCRYQVAYTHHINATLLRVNDSPNKILVRQCTVRYNESVEGASHLMSAWTELPVDREVCLRAHKTEKIELHGQSVDLQVTGTQRHRIYVGRNDKACKDLAKCPDAKIRDYEVTLTSYIGIVAIEFNLLRLEGKNVWCSYDDFECDYDRRKLFWEEVNEECETHYNAVFSGKMKLFQMRDGHTFTVAEIGNYRLVFELSKQHVLCSELAYQTQDTRWKVVLGVFQRIENIDFDIALFGEQVYIEKRAGEDEVTVGMIEKMCEANNEIFFKKLRDTDEELILKSHPAGVKIEIKGDKVFLKRCQPVPVRVRLTNFCYNLLPVYDQWGGDMFLIPKSQVLVSTAKSVPCVRDNKPEIVRDWRLEDGLDVLACIGAVGSFIWMMRSSFVKNCFRKVVNVFRRVPPVRTEQTNPPEISKFRRLLNSFLELIEPPFHV